MKLPHVYMYALAELSGDRRVFRLLQLHLLLPQYRQCALFGWYKNRRYLHVYLFFFTFTFRL